MIFAFIHMVMNSVGLTVMSRFCFDEQLEDLLR
jgi:hypothetical protein